MKRISRRESRSTRVERRRVQAAFDRALEVLEDRRMMSVTTSAPSYLVPSAPGVEAKPLITVGESVGGYQMVGLPDGMGAFDNGDGTFTVLMNQEIRPDRGGVRAHGSKGAFVSKWIIDKETLEVIGGEDLIKTVYTWDVTSGGYVAGTTAFNRLCSADLPAVTAFFNPESGLGTQERIFMDGEETNSGRAFAHVVSTGESWELPWTGKYAWENHVASPFPQDKTVVMGLDDSRREFASEGSLEPSEVYVWIGNKKEEGSVIERAGLVDGILHGLRVGSEGVYDANESTVTSGERFELVELSDQTNNTTFAPLQTESIAKSITQFRRVEDGHFDPNNPDVFYFVTTDQFGGQTRLWKLTFDDITNPEAGGVIEIAVDSPPNVPGEMFDNITANWNSDVLLQEDPGGQEYLAKIWQYDSSTGDLIQVAEHNPALFAPGSPGFLTRDEESSGIIDLSGFLGEGYYLVNVQAHFAQPDPLVEGGQLLVIKTNVAKATLGEDGVLTISGTINDDELSVTRVGANVLNVSFHGRSLGNFDRRAVKSIVMNGYAGSDSLTIAGNVLQSAILDGGLGDDEIRAGGGDSVVIGGGGADEVSAGAGEDIVIGDVTTLDNGGLRSALAIWTGSGSTSSRRTQVNALFADKVIDDGMTDVLRIDGEDDHFLDSGANDDVLLS